MPAGSIRINERLTLKENDAHGNQCITRMIHFTDNLRRLRLDTVEYAALKVIILMSSGWYFHFMLKRKFRTGKRKESNEPLERNCRSNKVYFLHPFQKLMSCRKATK